MPVDSGVPEPADDALSAAFRVRGDKHGQDAREFIDLGCASLDALQRDAGDVIGMHSRLKIAKPVAAQPAKIVRLVADLALVVASAADGLLIPRLRALIPFHPADSCKEQWTHSPIS